MHEAISVVLSAIISIGICLYKSHQDRETLNKKIQSQQSTTYKELITAERVRWLAELRSEMCAIMVTAYSIQDVCLAKQGTIKEEDYNIACTISEIRRHGDLIVLMISPDEKHFVKETNEFIKKIIEKANIQYEVSHKMRIAGREDINIDFLIDKFRKTCQTFLKNEWEKIKEEAEDMYTIH